MAGAHPLRTGHEELLAELREPPPTAVEESLRPAEAAAVTPASRVVEPRLAVVLTLIVAGIVWAVIRGLHFYGLAPIDIAYDLDQPPVLLMLVGGWLLCRSRGG